MQVSRPVKEYQGDAYYEKLRANHPSRTKVFIG
jgi:hypothetical protein